MNLHENPLHRAGAPIEEACAAVILLHGRGASPHDILRLADVLAIGDVAYVAPEASNNTWYPHSFLAPLAQNEPWLSAAIEAVRRACEEVVQAGIPKTRLFLAGFSQGACLSLEYAARRPARYAGVIGFSGGLIGIGEIPGAQSPDDKVFVYDGRLDGTHVFLGCSDFDPHIPVERVHQTDEAFRRMGATVTKRIYPGMPHTIIDDEIEFAREMIQSVLAE